MPVAPVSAPLLREPSVNLVKSSLNPLSPSDETNGRWIEGIAYTPEGFMLPEVLGPCSTADLIDVPLNPGTVTWHPYYAWTAVRCTAIDARNPDFDWMGRAQRQLAIGRIKAIEKEFWGGALAQSDPLLEGNNLWLAMPSISASPSSVRGAGSVGYGPIDLTPASGPVSIKYGLSLLEQGLADSGLGSLGMIHVRPEAAPIFTGVQSQGNLLFTQNGTVVVPGNGYPPQGPGGSTPAAGTSWMYATGIPEVRIDPNIQLLPDPTQTGGADWLTQATDTRTNTVVVYALQFVLASWDGQAHFAVHVNLTSDSTD